MNPAFDPPSPRAIALSATLAGEAAGGADYPGLAAGTAGLRFVEACLASSSAGAAWTAL